MNRKFLLLACFTVFLVISVSVYVFRNPDIKPQPLYTPPPTTTPSPAFKSVSISSVFGTHGRKYPEDAITLIATGDVIPARVVNIKAHEYNNFLWPWEKVADFTKSADITLINLETPIFDGCPHINSGFTFCGEDEHVRGLLHGGVDVANIANNHTHNFGQDGIDKTITLLQQNNIEYSGLTHTGYLTVKGVKFAFLGYNDVGAPFADEEQIKTEVTTVRQNADIVVVSFHWGTEYQSQPDPRQRELAYLAIDSGADLIVGNHPHWIQPIEIYQDKFIMYAHGNFIFDQEWSQKTKEGVVGKYIFVDKKLVDVEYFPILIEDFGQPRFLEGTEKERILNELKTETEILQKSL